MTQIFAAALFFIVAVGIVKMMKNKKSKKTAKENSSSPSPAGRTETSPENQENTAILNSLLKLNILTRKDADLSCEMTGEIEAVIDDLMVIIPLMMERYPSEALTYEIKKIGREHLYKTVKEYLDLSKQSRENQFDVFKKTLDSLHDVSRRSRDIVEKNEIAEFKTMANFLAGKFS